MNHFNRLIGWTSAEDTRRIHEAAAERELYARWVESKRKRTHDGRIWSTLVAFLLAAFWVLACLAWGL